MRKLKFHEQKLLKKVDFISWQGEDNIREIKILRRYHIQDREDYIKYNKIAGHITSLVAKLRQLPPNNEYRIKTTELLLQKLDRMGLIDAATSLSKAENIPASAFCRRRLPVVMVRLKMAPTLKEAVTYIEQGIVRVGPDVIKDPAYLVTRSMEDFVTWVDSSKIKRTIAKYNDKLDDFELLGL